MRVLLISANTESINMIPLPLGLNCVAVATRDAGHQIEMLDLMVNADHRTAVFEAINRTKPDAIGISIRNIDNQAMEETRFMLDPVREIISLCRTLSDASIIVGGAGFSIFPVHALQYVGADMGICGEGEIAFPLLLDALEKGSDLNSIVGLCLPGLPVQQEYAERAELNQLHLPDPKLWHVPDSAKDDLWIPFQTRRGCAMKCSYCSTPALEGTAIRKHRIDAVIEGLASHVACGFNRFYFVDNTFNLPPDYAKSLCRNIIDAGLDIQWRCILYPAFVDHELAQLMAESGCIEVSLGFESGNEGILRMLNKKFTSQQVRESSEALRAFGIRRMGFLLLGGPGETRESVLESLAFADSLKLDMLKLTMGIRIYPGTALELVAREEGVVTSDDNLLYPHFYLAQGLGDWLATSIKEWMRDRPYCCT